VRSKRPGRPTIRLSIPRAHDRGQKSSGFSTSPPKFVTRSTSSYLRPRATWPSPSPVCDCPCSFKCLACSPKLYLSSSRTRPSWCSFGLLGTIRVSLWPSIPVMAAGMATGLVSSDFRVCSLCVGPMPSSKKRPYALGRSSSLGCAAVVKPAGPLSSFQWIRQFLARSM
jgi:hypothetical protein